MICSCRPSLGKLKKYKIIDRKQRCTTLANKARCIQNASKAKREIVALAQRKGSIGINELSDSPYQAITFESVPHYINLVERHEQGLDSASSGINPVHAQGACSCFTIGKRDTKLNSQSIGQCCRTYK